MRDDWLEEVQDLHRFFQGWLRGELSEDDGTFHRLEGALAPGFTFVTTEGRLVSRGAFLKGLRRAHGSRPGLRIEIGQPNVIRREGPHLVATYRERQEDAAGASVRTSTVVLRRDREAPGGHAWVHVHESLQEPPA